MHVYTGIRVYRRKAQDACVGINRKLNSLSGCQLESSVADCVADSPWVSQPWLGSWALIPPNHGAFEFSFHFPVNKGGSCTELYREKSGEAQPGTQWPKVNAYPLPARLVVCAQMSALTPRE